MPSKMKICNLSNTVMQVTSFVAPWYQTYIVCIFLLYGCCCCSNECNMANAGSRQCVIGMASP